MLFAHAKTGRSLRLAYCMNLHPAETLDTVIEAMERVTLPLAQRLAHGQPFGVGMYFPASLARDLANDPAELARLAEFLSTSRLDPFTYNAFPAGGFGSAGLKERVFEPTWMEPERLDFTRNVAQIAAALAAAMKSDSAGRHISISTHTGMHSSKMRSAADERACAKNFVEAATLLANLEREGAPRMVLSLEAEPRANCNDTRELAPFLARIHELASAAQPDLARHLGACLDACHAAVEFESPQGAVERATEQGPLGKLQFSSALALQSPAKDSAGRAALFSMNEPAYLHQVTGRAAADSEAEFLRARDLPDLERAHDSADSQWSASLEWRCHFHVPVDLEQPLDAPSSGGLVTTRSLADEILDELTARPERWGTDELHVEIETYTWDLLPGPTRGAGDFVDGLEREYQHVLTRLAKSGWQFTGAL